MRMRYSIEPTERIYVSRYGFFFFAKNMGTHVTKVGKNLKNKYSQKLLDNAEKSNRCNKNCFKNSNSKNSRSNWWFNC